MPAQNEHDLLLAALQKRKIASWESLEQTALELAGSLPRLHGLPELASDASILALGARASRMDGLPFPAATAKQPARAPDFYAHSRTRGQLIDAFVETAHTLMAVEHTKRRSRKPQPDLDPDAAHLLTRLSAILDIHARLPGERQIRLPSSKTILTLVGEAMPLGEVREPMVRRVFSPLLLRLEH